MNDNKSNYDVNQHDEKETLEKDDQIDINDEITATANFEEERSAEPLNKERSEEIIEEERSEEKAKKERSIEPQVLEKNEHANK